MRIPRLLKRHPGRKTCWRPFPLGASTSSSFSSKTTLVIARSSSFKSLEGGIISFLFFFFLNPWQWKIILSPDTLVIFQTTAANTTSVAIFQRRKHEVFNNVRCRGVECSPPSMWLSNQKHSVSLKFSIKHELGFSAFQNSKQVQILRQLAGRADCRVPSP